MKIVFKNGKEVEIEQEVGNILRDRIKEGAKNWQLFSDEYNNVFLMINLLEVLYITK